MKNTSVALGEHFENFIAGQVASGRYRSASEVMRDALRLLEERNRHRDAVVAALIEGEQSGVSDRTPEDIRAAVRQEMQRDGRV
ncbi:MAG: type II toxin-antitoxin system ParD family antitoxin [Alphaproteobacteria bacterium]|nr:type II toxin-antitoxin system ParD family antitoxin [Alphaproteobacteria bacterium]MCB9928521.1 type II toxin-antitoxin system ParD family antitoxin [Alphaproteobacteria bacterium]